MFSRQLLKILFPDPSAPAMRSYRSPCTAGPALQPLLTNQYLISSSLIPDNFPRTPTSFSPNRLLPCNASFRKNRLIGKSVFLRPNCSKALMLFQKHDSNGFGGWGVKLLGKLHLDCLQLFSFRSSARELVIVVHWGGKHLLVANPLVLIPELCWYGWAQAAVNHIPPSRLICPALQLECCSPYWMLCVILLSGCERIQLSNSLKIVLIGAGLFGGRQSLPHLFILALAQLLICFLVRPLISEIVP